MTALAGVAGVRFGRSIVGAFARQPQARADAVAVQAGDRELTYAELEARANRLAHRLITLGVGKGDAVGVLAERTPETVASMLGVMKAGAAYSPLDPESPPLRLRAQLEDLRAPLVLAPEGLVAQVAETDLSVVTHSPDWRGFAQESCGPPELDVGPSDLYAVIFTSGSTGRPKGVAVEHGSMLSLMEASVHLAPGPGEGALQVCAPAFDVGAYEVWVTLLSGGRLVCHPPGRPDPAEVLATVRENDVTWAAPATGILHQLIEHGPAPMAGMRLVLTAGEQLLPRYVKRFRTECPEVRLLNTYGPTETTVFVSTHEVVKEDESADRVAVGRPIANARLRILDSDEVPVPAGGRGELYVGGAAVARGYLHQPELTAERFIEDPESAERWYRTGDLARERDDGELEILGRLDDQVKVRGYRVEPGEVEAQLAAHASLRRAAVIAREDVPGHRRLVAYVVPANGSLDEVELRAYLGDRLPEYMVPSVFVELERLPQTPIGKVDREALPAPGAPQRPAAPSAAGGEAAASAETIAEVFAAVLRVPRVAPDDDFLALGGDSLLAVQALVRLRETHGIELPVAAVFDARTPRKLAAVASAVDGDAPRLPPLRGDADREGKPVPATTAQAKVLLIGELAEESLPYQSQSVYRILGPLDKGALERALTAMVQRHEMLRTTFERIEGVWMPRLHEPPPLRLGLTDLAGAGDPERALEEHFEKAVRLRLDPARLPLMRWSLVRLAAEDHALLSLEHHAVHDGVSTANFLHELSALYAAERRGAPSELAPLAVQYRDFARWQASLASTAYGRRTIDHWRQRLHGAPATLPLLLDRPRPPRQTYRGRSPRLRLPEALAGRLESRALQCGATLFVLMLAGYCELLARYAGVEELVLGTGLANRRTLASEPLIGMVVNTVALRIDLRGARTVGELVDRVRAAVLDAEAHQDVPFEQVVEHLAPVRSGNSAPLYQVLFSFHDAPVQSTDLAGATLVPRDALGNGSAKADLNVHIIRRREGPPPGLDRRKYDQVSEAGLTVVWEYNSDLFDRGTAEQMLGRYQRLLEQLAESEPDRPRSNVSLTDALERATALELSGRSARYERDGSVAEVFQARAAELPRAPAVSFEGLTLTYRQLDRRSNRLANRLRAWGIDSGARVGVCLERSLDLAVSLLAIVKAGAAYVPLEPNDPPARLRGHLETLDVGLVLTHTRHAEALPSKGVRLMCLDDEQDLEREPDTPPPGVLSPMDPLYVMFTSGSSGAPKGVEVPHRAVLRLVRGSDYARLGPHETLLAVSPPAFDASTFELWGALLTGGRVVVAPPGALSTGELADLVAREGVSTLWLTAGLFHRIVDDRPELLRGLRQLLCGGDVLSPDHVRRALLELPEGAVLINGYGPTEATTFTCTHTMAPGDPVEVPVPIGRPIAGTRVYILDQGGALAPIGVPGELWIGGDGVALGYAGDPELTAQRFREDPFSNEVGARMYRSGDRARWRTDGVLEFLGRGDRQLKVRGFRVEPAEIEDALRRHPDVADVHVAPYRRASSPEVSLAAYVVARAGSAPTDSELRAFASGRLPTHAIPTAWSRLARLPLTANGKVDDQALPPPTTGGERARGSRSNPARVSAGRPDSLERRLIAIWERALDLETIGPEEDFFELGGHSLLAVEVFDAIERSFGRQLPLATIFEAPTVRRLAACLREDGWEQPRQSLVTLTATGTRPPLFFVSDGNSVGFGALARRLGQDQPFYALQPRGIGGGALLQVRIERMAEHYLRAIRRLRPHGPYLLGGRCLGAIVAYEMARRLEAGGEDTPLLVVLDSAGPRWRPRKLADGTPYDPVMNSALRRPGAPLERLGDVFSPEGSTRLLEWLAETVVKGADGTAVSRYLYEVYHGRPDIRDEFPELAGADARALVQWAWRHGRSEQELYEPLLGDPVEPSLAAPVNRRSVRSGERRNATTAHLAWRGREVADLLGGARRPGTGVRRRARLREAAVAAAGAYRAGSYGGVLTLIRSEEYRVQSLLELWHGVETAGVVELHVPGTHRSMMREPDVAGLAACLQGLVDQVCDASLDAN